MWIYELSTFAVMRGTNRTIFNKPYVDHQKSRIPTPTIPRGNLCCQFRCCQSWVQLLPQWLQ